MRNPIITRRRLAVALLAIALVRPVAACAQACDPNTEARLQFIESRLDAGKRNAKLWYWGWMSVFTIGFVYGIVDGAAIHEDQSNQANSYITSAKSALGIADLTLIRPYPSRHGADLIRAIPKSSAEMCGQRLALAEKTLRDASEEGSMRWSWKRHLWSFTLNLGTGLAVAYGWHDQGTGWKSFGVSEASSEAFIWTHPTRARYDWQDYQHDFGGSPVSMAAPAYWDFAAQPGGIGVVWHF